MHYSCRVVAKENLRELYLCSSLGEESGPQGTEQLGTVARRLVSTGGSDQEKGIILCVIPEATGLLQLKAILPSVQPSIKGIKGTAFSLPLLSFSPSFPSSLCSSLPSSSLPFPFPSSFSLCQTFATDFFLFPAYLLSFQLPDRIHCCFTNYLHTHPSTLALFIKILILNKV